MFLYIYIYICVYISVCALSTTYDKMQLTTLPSYNLTITIICPCPTIGSLRRMHGLATELAIGRDAVSRGFEARATYHDYYYYYYYYFYYYYYYYYLYDYDY